MTMLTKEKFMAKYGEQMVQFNSYVDGVFTFYSKMEDDRTIKVSIFGYDSQGPVAVDIHVNEFIRIIDLQPYAGAVYEGNIYVEGFYVN